MSRSGYSDDCENWELIKYRGMVASACRGKRGQAFFKELLAALDSMSEKKLIAEELEVEGQVCALGALGKSKGLDMTKFDPYDSDTVAKTFNIADCLAREVAYENDNGSWSRHHTPEQRWQRMRDWVINNISM